MKYPCARRVVALLVAVCAGLCTAKGFADDDGDENSSSTNSPAAGHSLHGEAFDEGPRQAATLMPGTGKVKLKITSKQPKAQAFFNQGVGQLHGF